MRTEVSFACTFSKGEILRRDLTSQSLRKSKALSASPGAVAPRTLKVAVKAVTAVEFT
ncbi:hypothetical protein RSK20926_16647 [Roseobacter sp. SK209-2-6]|nr:hypothetical protein RSK20926_16647 [Roseobacter sp. SK209-2-6]